MSIDHWLVLFSSVTILLLCTGMVTCKVPEDFDYSLAKADNELGFEIFTDLARENPQENLFISPLSIAMALQMCYAGASGKTQSQMAEVMRFSGMPPDVVSAGNLQFLDALQSEDSEVTIEIANSLWGRAGIPFEKEFIETIEQYYNGEATELDFVNPASVSTINQWVSENTHGKITQIIEQLDPLAIMVLVNAVYFKGAWQAPFNERATGEEDFYFPDESTAKVMMMNKHDDMSYFETEDFQAVKLDYKGRDYEMLVFLPSMGSSLEKFVKKIDAENWAKWLEGFRTRDGRLGLPRFKVEYKTVLNDALMGLGMKDAFVAADADFSSMTPFKPAWISSVIHKTFIEVDEQGTEAAAVTAIEMCASAAPGMDRPRPFSMVVDRPFFCAIRHIESGAIVFMGAIYEPE